MGYITLMIKGLTRMALVCAGLAAAVWIALQLSGQGSGSRQIDHAALPPVAVGPQEEPPVAAAARFLGAWEAGRYSEMYAMLSRTARHGVSEAQFVKLYQDFARDGTVVGVTAAVDRLALGSTAHRNALQAKGKEAPKLPAGKGAAAPAPPPEEIIPIQTTFETTQVGRFSERNALTLVKEGAAWTVNWTPDALLKDFAAKAKLRVNAKDGAARRGRLLDRDGAPLAWSEQVFRIGIVPGRISDEPQMLTTLAEMLGKTPAEVKAVYNKSRANWLIPLGDLPETRRAEVDSRLRNLAGVQVDEVTVRRYREPVLAGPALGLIGQITQWEEQTLAGRGYRDGDWVGRTGVEQWADVSLAGIRGGSLAIIAPDGGYVRQVAQQPQRPGKDVRLTLDSGVQRAAEDAAGAVGLKGALVVLDAATRQVLALVSRPGVDPGAVANNLQNEQWRWGIQNPASEFQVRAAAAYPFGPLAEFLGFGSPEVGMKAGIGGLLNAVGLTPPAHAAKIAEGQATAFQFAVVTAALATDGKLLAPLLVQNISDANGDVDRRYEPKDLGALPLTADQLVDVRKRLAEMPQEPETLLATTLAGFPRAVAAADAQTDETGGPAWFAGYAPAEAPRYVVVAVAEASDDANAKVMKAARGTLDRLGL